MKRLCFLICLSISVQSFAQTNLLDKVGLKHIFPWAIEEINDSYYFMDFVINQQVINPDYPDVRPIQYNLYRVNSHTNTIVYTRPACGDTIQADSVVLYDRQMLKSSPGRLHLVYIKVVLDTVYNKGYTKALCYIQFDTALNITVPETRLLIADNTKQYDELDLNDICAGVYQTVIGYTQFDTVKTTQDHLAKYLIVDSSGNIVKADTIGKSPTTAFNANKQNVCEIISRGKNGYLVTGMGLLSKYNEFHAYTTDSMMNMIDSIGFPMSFPTAPPPNFRASTYNRPNIVDLPTGGLIGGTIINRYPIDEHWTGIIKTYGNVSAIPTILNVVEKQDSTDFSHNSEADINGFANHTIAYNALDNRVYYANETHTGIGSCFLNHSYTQVVCTDTNANILWRKFIYAGDSSCAVARSITACHNRSGVLVAGTISIQTFASSTREFIYYVDSTGPVGINDDGLSARDRFEVYPNPTTSVVHIDDIFKTGGVASIYSMTGSLVSKQQYSAKQPSINLSEMPPGLYLIRIITDDNELFQYKIIRQ